VPTFVLSNNVVIRMHKISTMRLIDGQTLHTAATFRREADGFTAFLSSLCIPAVRVWCGWNPGLPDNSPHQSPEATLPPSQVLEFLDAAVRNGSWNYADNFNRAAIEGPDGSFTFFFGNDRDLSLETDDSRLLDSTRRAWTTAGYEIFEGQHPIWRRASPPADQP
jgi:hypothetical protein